MGKIGSSVLSKPYKQKTVSVVNSLPVYVNEVLLALNKAERPLNVAEVREDTNIGSWITVKRILDSLIAKGIVEIAFTSGRSLFYRIKNKGA